MKNFDKQLYAFKDRLIKDVVIDEKYLTTICSTIYSELSFLSKEKLTEIEDVSPVKLINRIEELYAFNRMMDKVNYGEL
jgi:hypothetical protein